jgi:NAD(P)-dependent dehydrogenase (short-subunit alcohol dehydrogenase family)
MDPATANHAFITGGASGIGLGLAKALAALGVAVTIADIDREGLDGTVAASDGKLRGTLLDVRDRSSWARAKAEAENALGPVDLLFNNAGVPGSGDHLADIAPDRFEDVIATNLLGVFNGIHAFAAGMRERRMGHIVNTSSMQGMAVDGPGVAAYGSAKAGVIALSEVLAREMAPHGVGVSVYCPGMTWTPMVAAALGRQGTGEGLPTSLSVTPMAVDVAAQIVLRGIAANRLYIITHPARMAAVEQRFAAIRSDCEAGTR